MSQPHIDITRETTIVSSESAPEKKVIAVDLDEVLGKFVHPLANWHNEAYSTTLTEESFFSYEFHHVWGGTSEEANVKVTKFFESHHFSKQPKIEGAFEVLSRLKKNYKLVLVTSRQLAIREHTEEFLRTHYPNIFDEIRLGNHYSTSGPVLSKPEMCKALGAVLLIDDSLKYARQCAEAGIKVLLFGSYAWNRVEDDSTLHANIKRVLSWDHVESALEQFFNNEIETQTPQTIH